MSTYGAPNWTDQHTAGADIARGRGETDEPRIEVDVAEAVPSRVKALRADRRRYGKAAATRPMKSGEIGHLLAFIPKNLGVLSEVCHLRGQGLKHAEISERIGIPKIDVTRILRAVTAGKKGASA